MDDSYMSTSWYRNEPLNVSKEQTVFLIYFKLVYMFFFVMKNQFQKIIIINWKKEMCHSIVGHHDQSLSAAPVP